jgi:hypothetical protein
MALWIPSLMIICFMSNGASAFSEWAAVPGAVIDGEDDEIHRGNYTLDACKQACSEESWCKSIEFTTICNGTCKLSRKRASEVGGLATPSTLPLSNITYYERFFHTCQTVHIPKAALQGHNRKSLYGHQTVASCTRACLAEPWCKSFDWHGNSGSCCLSDKKASDVNGLKYDYRGDPYDYYELAPRTHAIRLSEGHQAMAPPPVMQSSFFVGACVGSLSLAGIAMGVIAIRRACKHAGQNGHGLLDRDDEHIQLEEQ